MARKIILNPQVAMRIAGAAILFFDYLMTLPSEYRLYRRQRKWYKPSAACILFILTRYIGLVAVVLSTFFFFNSSFTPATCVPAIGGAFRALSATLVSVIFLWRTWAIWNKRRSIFIVLLIALIPTSIFTWGSVFHQTPITTGGVCTGVAGPGVFGAKWPFALANMLFDTLTCALSSWKLVQNLRLSQSHISTILLGDGLGYLFIVLLCQALNLSFLLNSNPAKQSTLLTFTLSITVILSQRIITSLSERIINTPSTQDSKPREVSASRSRSRWGAPSVGHVERIQRSAMQTSDGNSDLELGRVPVVKVDVTNETHVHMEDVDSKYGLAITSYNIKHQMDSQEKSSDADSAV